MKLVETGLSDAAMFDPEGSVLQPSEILYKKNVLVERGSFRPVCHVNIDMMNSARTAFQRDLGPDGGEIVELMELTMRNLRADGSNVSRSDFMARVEMLAASGKTVLISDYFEYYRLAAFLSRCTRRCIGITMGAGSLIDLFDEQYYTSLPGGILESFGRLFKNDLRLYIYPLLRPDGALTTVSNLELPQSLRKLYGHLVDSGSIRQLEDVNREHMKIFSRDVLAKIRNGESDWEKMVPAAVAAVIKRRRFLGYQPQ